MDPKDIQSILSSRARAIKGNQGAQLTSDVIQSSLSAYEKCHKTNMPDGRKMLLMNSFNALTDRMVRSGVTREAIMSASADISNVDNPLSMLFNLMSILIPNFAYLEVAGVQPMPTKESPLFFPQLQASTTRNGVTTGDTLLGSSNWISNNRYTGNRPEAEVIALTDASTAVSGTLTVLPALPETVTLSFYLSGITYEVTDNGAGGFTLPAAISSLSVNYTTGVITGVLAAAATVPGDTLTADYRFDLDTKDPAQALFTWETIPIVAQPHRLRSSYELDNFYQAKQVLQGYNIDEVMSSALAGYINKEISGGVFDNMLTEVDADYTWDKTEPSGVAWAFHRLEVLQTLVEASNAIRLNVSRSGGNKIVAGNDLMNIIETLGNDVWLGDDYKAEPIGPYKAGRLFNRFDVIKNQDYPEAKSVMAMKRDETDASYAVGQFIGLYATNPLAQDTLEVVQGMGTQIGETKVFDNSLISITITET